MMAGVLPSAWRMSRQAHYRFESTRHVQLIADYQRIENPGFNRDRGPANVVGFRVHLDY